MSNPFSCDFTQPMQMRLGIQRNWRAMQIKMIISVLLIAQPPSSLRAQTPRPDAPGIADNSFLIEEAYNQEAGIVQHISAFQRSLRDRQWLYTFTQEWPLRGQHHQFSVTLPVEHVALAGAGVTGVGDIGLNYRYQLLGAAARVAVAPRLSLLLPTGNEKRALGNGGWGVQANLPVSVALSSRLITHWNAGTTVIPGATNELGEEAGVQGYSLGGSVIWQARRTFHFLCEMSWTRDEFVTGPGQTGGEVSITLNPGIRWAHNFPSGLQIVPGIAVPIGLGPSWGELGLFLYLSFEHAFRRNPM
jgi:hypothetical protein